MFILSIDAGVSTGICCLYYRLDTEPPYIVLGQYELHTTPPDMLEAMLASFKTTYHPITIAERPLTPGAGKLTRQLQEVISTIDAVFPSVEWIRPIDWAQSKIHVKRTIDKVCPEIYQATRRQHEKDALMMAIWHLYIRKFNSES